MKMNISKFHVISFLDLLSRIDLDELMKKDEPPLDFADTLEGFEYAFNESKWCILYICKICLTMLIENKQS